MLPIRGCVDLVTRPYHPRLTYHVYTLCSLVPQNFVHLFFLGSHLHGVLSKICYYFLLKICGFENCYLAAELNHYFKNKIWVSY